MQPIYGQNYTAISSGQVAAASGAVLWSATVNTGATSAVLKLYNGSSAAGQLLATIDASATGSYWYGFYCPAGIFYALSGAAADVSIGYSFPEIEY